MAVGSALGDLNVVQAGQARLWLAMSTVAKPHMDEERRTLVARTVYGVDLRALVEGDPEVGAVVLRCAAELARASGDPAARSSFEEELIRYAGHVADASSGRRSRTDSDPEMVSNIVEAAVAVSRCDTEAEGWCRFGPLMIRLANAWPAAVPRFRDGVGALAMAAHPAMASCLWDAWLELRAMR